MSLNRLDVVTVNCSNRKVTAGTTFTVGEFANAVAGLIQKSSGAPYQEWANEGVDCSVLQPGSENWVKGKVRVSLEFIPDKAEEVEEEEAVLEIKDTKVAQNLLPSSPLADLREKLSIQQ